MKLLRSDEGVSESLGFVLLAMILMMVMSMVMMIGYPIFQQSVNEGHMQNMAEGFYLMTSNFNKVALYESPIQSSELKLYGGVLSLKDDGDFTLTYRYFDGSVDVPKSITASPHHRIMEYSLNNEKVAYLMGGVLQKEGSDSIVLRDLYAYQYPPHSTNPSTVVIPIIEYDDNSISALGGADLARVEVRSPYYSKWEGTTDFSGAVCQKDVEEIWIDISSDYNGAISRYFTEELGFQDGTDINGNAPAPGHIILYRRYAAPLTASGVTLYIPRGSLMVSMS